MVTELVGGNVALDLANTLEGPAVGEADTDHLRTPADLAAWATHAGLQPPPALTAALLRRAHELRAAIDAIFRAVAAGEEPRRQALDALAAAHAEAVARARLIRSGDGFDLVWDRDVLGPIARAAVDLLRAGPLDRIKVCDACRWLFVDASRNRSRRWCTMSDCGASSKMRRYRARRATAGR